MYNISIQFHQGVFDVENWMDRWSNVYEVQYEEYVLDYKSYLNFASVLWYLNLVFEFGLKQKKTLPIRWSTYVQYFRHSFEYFRLAMLAFYS